MKTRAPVWFAIIMGMLALFWLYRSLTSPETPQTTFYPLTDFARSTHGVYTFTNVLMLGIFVAIEGFLVYTLFRFRTDEPKSELPDQVHGHTGLEIGFTVATTMLVIVLFVPSCQQIAYQQGSTLPDDTLTVEVTGRQWWWEFYYPEYDLVVANEMVVPTGRTVNLDLSSADVIHAFWIPRLGGKRDLVPGRHQNIWFTPEVEGRFEGQCAEYCGTSHANMAMEVVVKSPADFEAWVAQQKAPTPPSTDPLALQGQVAFLTAGGCITCHSTFQNDGLVRGMQGPNLRKVATRHLIASGMFPNDKQNLFHWVKNPQAMKPGALMNVVNPSTLQCTGPAEPQACCTAPQTGNCLDDSTVEQLVAYLQSLE